MGSAQHMNEVLRRWDEGRYVYRGTAHVCMICGGDSAGYVWCRECSDTDRWLRDWHEEVDRRLTNATVYIIDTQERKP